MKKTAQKKKQIFIGLLMAICFLLISVQVQAATKSKISIKVNGTESATLEKNRSIWSITTGEEEKDKQILSSKVVYLKIPKGKELVTGYYAFNSKGVMDTRRIFHSLDTKSAKYVLKEPIILVKQMEDYGSINLAGHRWETRNIIFQKPENVHKQMGMSTAC